MDSHGDNPEDLEPFLESTAVIDWRAPAIVSLANELSVTASEQLSLARRTFEWVRDNIEHCLDFNRDEVTCKASDVLLIGTGFCYAKSHLLAALLRANGIAAGLCYQRLSTTDGGPPFCLHGLNAVHLDDFGWYRIDARGNTASIQAQFTPPEERLAFHPNSTGEADVPGIWAEPLPAIVEALGSSSSAQKLAADLPDMAPNP